MKIAFVNHPTDYVLPGSERTSITLISRECGRRLAACHEITIYARKNRAFCRETVHAGICYKPVSCCPSRALTALLRLAGPLRGARRPSFSSVVYHLPYWLRVSFDLWRGKYDLVHIHNFSQAVSVIRAMNRRIRIILHMNMQWLTQLEPRMVAARLRNTDLVASCSQFIEDGIREHFPEFSDRCFILRNAADCRQASIKRPPVATEGGQLNILYVGRIAPEKGIHILLEAFSRISEQFPMASLTLVGALHLMPTEVAVGIDNDPLVRDLARFYPRQPGLVGRLRSLLGAGDRTPVYRDHLAKLLGPFAANRVRWVGEVVHDEIGTYLEQADVFVHPSVWHDPFPLAVLEPMAAGLPVVATLSGGIPEAVVHGETGLLVLRNNADALAEAIATLLNSAEMRRQFGQAGRKRANECFSWDRVADELRRQLERMRC